MFVDVAGRFKMRSRTGGLLDLAFATFIPALFVNRFLNRL